MEIRPIASAIAEWVGRAIAAALGHAAADTLRRRPPCPLVAGPPAGCVERDLVLSLIADARASCSVGAAAEGGSSWPLWVLVPLVILSFVTVLFVGVVIGASATWWRLQVFPDSLEKDREHRLTVPGMPVPSPSPKWKGKGVLKAIEG